jgi:hypothetical protein
VGQLSTAFYFFYLTVILRFIGNFEVAILEEINVQYMAFIKNNKPGRDFLA